MDSGAAKLAHIHGVTTPWGNDIWSRPTLLTLDKERFLTTYIGYYDSYWFDRNITFKAMAGPLHPTADAFWGSPQSPLRILPQVYSLVPRSRLRRLITENKIDILTTHSYLPGLPETARRLGVKSVLWSIDDPMGHCPLWFDYAREFDVVLTMSDGSIADYKEHGSNRVYFMPWAADTRIFGTIEVAEKTIDISFVGTNSPDRGPGIRNLLIPLINRYGKRFQLYGHRWERYTSCSVHGEVRDLEAARLFTSSKVVLNFHREPARKKYCSLRPSVFEVMACNTLMACDEANGIDFLFEPRREFVSVNGSNVLELIDYYMNAPEEAAKIAKAGQEKVLKNHTVKHRAKAMEDIFKANF